MARSPASAANARLCPETTRKILRFELQRGSLFFQQPAKALRPTPQLAPASRVGSRGSMNREAEERGAATSAAPHLGAMFREA